MDAVHEAVFDIDFIFWILGIINYSFALYITQNLC